MKTKTLKRIVCPNGAVIPKGTEVVATYNPEKRTSVKVHCPSPYATHSIRGLMASSYLEGFLDIVAIKSALEGAVVRGQPSLSLTGEELEAPDAVDKHGFPSIEKILLY